MRRDKFLCQSPTRLAAMNRLPVLVCLRTIPAKKERDEPPGNPFPDSSLKDCPRGGKVVFVAYLRRRRSSVKALKPPSRLTEVSGMAVKRKTRSVLLSAKATLKLPPFKELLKPAELMANLS